METTISAELDRIFLERGAAGIREHFRREDPGILEDREAMRWLDSLQAREDAGEDRASILGRV